MKTIIADAGPIIHLAEANCLEAHGSLGLVLASVAMGRFGYKAGLNALNRLRASSLWLSRSVYERAIEALGSLCDGTDRN